MLRTFDVRFFKSIESVVNLELGSINVFIGPNGAGKSNLLEALGVLSAAANGRVDDEALLRRGVRPGLPVLYKSSFKEGKGGNEIRFGAQSDGASYDVGLFNPIEHPWPAWHFHTESLYEGDLQIVGRSHHTRDKKNPEAGLAALKLVEMEPQSPAAQLLELLRNFAIFSPNTATLRGLVSDAHSREPIGLSGGRLAEAVQELFQEMSRGEKVNEFRGDIFRLISWSKRISSRASDIVPRSPSVPTTSRVLRFTDRYMKDKRSTFTAYDASEGALYVLFTAVAALHSKMPKLLAIDNADHGLNPWLARELMKCLCKWVLNASVPRQLLLTTHNPLVLDGLPLQDDRVRLFVTNRSRLGKTIIKRIVVTEELMARAREGVSLSQLWLLGQLGGMPNDF
jgi:energy-coupling factor transporter ATP-binding protein EcfA2